MIETEEAIVLTPDEVLDVIVADVIECVLHVKAATADTEPGIVVAEVKGTDQAYVMGMVCRDGKIERVLNIGLLVDDVPAYKKAIKDIPYAYVWWDIDSAVTTKELWKWKIERLCPPTTPSRYKLNILRDRQRPFFVAANDLADEAEARQIFEARKDGFRPVAG